MTTLRNMSILCLIGCLGQITYAADNNGFNRQRAITHAAQHSPHRDASHNNCVVDSRKLHPENVQKHFDEMAQEHFNKMRAEQWLKQEDKLQQHKAYSRTRAANMWDEYIHASNETYKIHPTPAQPSLLTQIKTRLQQYTPDAVYGCLSAGLSFMPYLTRQYMGYNGILSHILEKACSFGITTASHIYTHETHPRSSSNTTYWTSYGMSTLAAHASMPSSLQPSLWSYIPSAISGFIGHQVRKVLQAAHQSSAPDTLETMSHLERCKSDITIYGYIDIHNLNKCNIHQLKELIKWASCNSYDKAILQVMHKDFIQLTLEMSQQLRDDLVASAIESDSPQTLETLLYTINTDISNPPTHLHILPKALKENKLHIINYILENANFKSSAGSYKQTYQSAQNADIVEMLYNAGVPIYKGSTMMHSCAIDIEHNTKHPNIINALHTYGVSICQNTLISLLRAYTEQDTTDKQYALISTIASIIHEQPRLLNDIQMHIDSADISDDLTHAFTAWGYSLHTDTQNVYPEHPERSLRRCIWNNTESMQENASMLKGLSDKSYIQLMAEAAIVNNKRVMRFFTNNDDRNARLTTRTLEYLSLLHLDTTCQQLLSNLDNTTLQCVINNAINIYTHYPHIHRNLIPCKQNRVRQAIYATTSSIIDSDYFDYITRQPHMAHLVRYLLQNDSDNNLYLVSKKALHENNPAVYYQAHAVKTLHNKIDNPDIVNIICSYLPTSLHK